MLSQVAHFDQHRPRGFMSQTHGGGTPPLSSVPSGFFEAHHSSSQLSVLGNGVQDPCAHIFCCEKNWNRLGQNFVLFHLLEARYTVVPFGRRKNIWRSNCYPSLLHRGSWWAVHEEEEKICWVWNTKRPNKEITRRNSVTNATIAFLPRFDMSYPRQSSKIWTDFSFFPVFTRRRWWWARGGRGLERGPFVHQPQVSPPRSRGVVGVGVGVTGEGLARVGALQLPSVLEEGRNLVILEERRSKNCESCCGSQSYCRVNSSRGGTHLPSCLSPSKC